MAKKAKTKDVAKKTIEQTLWDSANELRGNLDAAEYKSVVLGLVFLKYINDCFKVKHDELIAEGAGLKVFFPKTMPDRSLINAAWVM